MVNAERFLLPGAGVGANEVGGKADYQRVHPSGDVRQSEKVVELFRSRVRADAARLVS